MKAIAEYTSTLQEIQSATRSGTIRWRRNGSDSFKYQIMNEDLEDLIVNLQKVDDDYYLSLIKKDFESSEVLLNLDTTNWADSLKEALSELYELVEYHVDLQNLEGLNKFIEIIDQEQQKPSLFD